MKPFLKKLMPIFFVLLVSLYLIAFFNPLQKAVINYLLGSFTEEKGIQLTFREVDGNLFRHLSFKDIKIGKFAEIPEFEVTYNIFSLIGANKRISTIYIKNPSLNIDEALKLNLRGEGEGAFVMVDSFVIDSSVVHYKDFTVPFSLFMKMTDKNIEIKRFTLDYPRSNFLFTGDYKLDGEFDFSHKFDLDLLELSKIEGNMTSEGKMKGTGKNPAGLGNLSFSSNRFGALSINYEVKDSILYLQDINIINKKISLKGNASFNFRKNLGNFSLILLGADQKFIIDGNFNKNIVISSLKGKEISAIMECNFGDTINLNVKGRYRNSPLNMTLSYIDENLKGNISISYLPLNEDISFENIGGHFDIKTLEGAVNGKTNLNIKKVLYRNEEIGKLDITSDIKDNKAKIKTTGLIKGKGDIQLKKPNLFYFDFSMKDFDLSAFLPEGDGKTDCSGEIKGDIAKPKELSITLNIENFESNFRESIIRSMEKIRIKYLYPHILIAPAAVYFNESKLNFSGEIPISENEEIKFTFSTQNFQLEALNPFVEIFDFEGLLDLNFSLAGKIRNPEISGYLELDSLFLFKESDTLGPFEISAEANRHNLIFDVLRVEYEDIVLVNVDPISLKFDKDFIEIEPSKISLFEDYISFSGIIPVPFKGEMDLNISTDEFRLQGLNSLTPKKIKDGNLSSNLKILKVKPFPSLIGKISVSNLVLQAEEKKTVGPLSLNMVLSDDNIVIDKFVFLINDEKIANDGDLTLNLNREFVAISQGRLKIADNLFSLYGRIPVDKNSEFDIFCNFDSLNMSILSPLFPGSIFSGYVSSSINLKGTRIKPQVYGNLVFENNVFKTKETSIGPVNGIFYFNGDIINCSEIFVGFNKGFLLLNGSIGLNKDASLNLDLQKIELPVRKKSYLTINGNLKLSSSLDIYSVSGEIKLDGLYMDAFENQLIVGMLKKANRPASKSSNVLDKTKLNIDIGSNFIVNNRESYIKTESDLYVSGTAAKPGITGETKIIEGGHLNYLGTKFNVNGGTINFKDPATLKPELDLRASSEIFHEGINYLIFLNISGTPDKLRIEVSSEPYMPVQEVLALLITGKTRKIEPISSAQGIGTKAVNHVLDVTKGRIEERLASALGVEKVTIDNSAAMKIGLEKQIGKKMKVSYKTGFEDFRKPQLVIYYDILRNVSVFSIYDRENRDVEAGFDIDLTR